MIMNRRHFMLAAAGSAFGAKAAWAGPQNAYDFTFQNNDGSVLPLSTFHGQVLLIVNTASQCAFTNQYAGLQKLWTRYRARGLTVIAVPSNDFGGQEPGEDSEIMGFCSSAFGVTFPLAAKDHVKGEAAHPFYQWAANEDKNAVPRWNFHKLLIDRRGHLAKAYGSSTPPESETIALALEVLLAGSSGT